MITFKQFLDEGYVSHAQRKAVWASRNEKGIDEEEQLDEVGDTAKGQKTLTKVHKRAVNRMISAIDKKDTKAAKKNQDTANRAWDRFDVKEELSTNEQFDIIEEFVEDLASQHQLDSEVVWEQLESIDDDELFEAAVDAKGHKSSTGGLTQKGRDYYNNKTGGNLKAPVTTKPSKLDPDSKAAKRRKSFCARMGGMKKRLTSAKTANDPDSRINKALRKWNC